MQPRTNEEPMRESVSDRVDELVRLARARGYRIMRGSDLSARAPVDPPALPLATVHRSGRGRRGLPIEAAP